MGCQDICGNETGCFPPNVATVCSQKTDIFNVTSRHFPLTKTGYFRRDVGTLCLLQKNQQNQNLILSEALRTLTFHPAA